MSETRTVTKEFEVTHATITYSDGSTENIEYTFRFEEGDFVHYLPPDHIDRSVTAYRCIDRYSITDDSMDPIMVANDAITKITPSWQEELVAVAEFEVEDTSWFLGSPKYEIVGDPDVEVWDRTEWEASDE